MPKITLPGARIQAQPCLTFPQLSGASWPGQQPGTRCVTYLRPGKEPLPLSEVPHRWVVAWSRLPGLVWGQGPTVSSPPGTQPEWAALICSGSCHLFPLRPLASPCPFRGLSFHLCKMWTWRRQPLSPVCPSGTEMNGSQCTEHGPGPPALSPPGARDPKLPQRQRVGGSRGGVE